MRFTSATVEAVRHDEGAYTKRLEERMAFLGDGLPEGHALHGAACPTMSRLAEAFGRQGVRDVAAWACGPRCPTRRRAAPQRSSWANCSR